MRALWSDANRFSRWLDVEIAAMAALEAQGGVESGATLAVELATADRATVIDPTRIAEIEQTTRHDVIAFLTSLEEKLGAIARPIHKGLTSSDVVDTALAMQLRDAGCLIEGELKLLCDALRTRAIAHKRTLMIGRTHGVHAEPTTLGLVFALWYAELTRHRVRIRRAIEEISVAKLSGAVGTYANTNPEFEQAALARLGLTPEPVSNQVVQRDRHATFFNALAVLAASIEKCALQIRHWQRTEVGEAEERFHAGQKGSSAMPHKRNPVLSENLTGLARMVRAYAGAAMENVALWHERDISHSSVERVIGPDATSLVHFMLVRMTGIVANLVVYPERMQANLDQLGGVIYSQRVLLALVDAGVDRQAAYVMVQRNAMSVHRNGGTFLDTLLADDDLTAFVARERLERCFDPWEQLQHLDAIFQRVFDEN